MKNIRKLRCALRDWTRWLIVIMLSRNKFYHASELKQYYFGFLGMCRKSCLSNYSEIVRCSEETTSATQVKYCEIKILVLF